MRYEVTIPQKWGDLERERKGDSTFADTINQTLPGIPQIQNNTLGSLFSHVHIFAPHVLLSQCPY